MGKSDNSIATDILEVVQEQQAVLNLATKVMAESPQLGKNSKMGAVRTRTSKLNSRVAELLAESRSMDASMAENDPVVTESPKPAKKTAGRKTTTRKKTARPKK